MNTTFYLVRHALKEKAIGDVPISPFGILQAEATAKTFRDIPVKAIFTSPLRRAKETAAYIARETNLTASEDIRLRERANWGDLPGQTFEEFVSMWNRCTHDRDYMPPVGDSARQAGERLSSLLSDLAESHPESHIVIVTHGGLIADFMVNAFSTDELYEWHPDFYNVQSELVPECSITKVACDGAKYKLLDFASTAHLNG